MAHDLFFGHTRRNWARGSRLPESSPPSIPEASDEVTEKFTEEEMAFVAKLAETKAKAEAGDKSAKRQYAKMPKTILALKAKSKKGDLKAKRMLTVLEKSGLFKQGQALTITETSGIGYDEILGSFVRDEDRVRGCESGCGAVIPHSNYRIAILRQAIRRSNGRSPSTKDIFVAKSKVDRVIGKAGATLYLPGARPGRRTV
jgi:hypothetical protein